MVFGSAHIHTYAYTSMHAHTPATTAQHSTAQHSTVCALATLAGRDCTAVWFDVTWRPRCTKLYELNSACGAYKPVLCIDYLVALISLKL